MLTYELRTTTLPDDANPEFIAGLLEAAAEQVRNMSSCAAAHSMRKTIDGTAVRHGTEQV